MYLDGYEKKYIPMLLAEPSDRSHRTTTPKSANAQGTLPMRTACVLWSCRLYSLGFPFRRFLGGEYDV
jgi:hypothetical protein